MLRERGYHVILERNEHSRVAGSTTRRRSDCLVRLGVPEPALLRLALGTLTILLSFGVAAVVGSLDRFNSNAWFGTATKELIDAAVTELEAGNQARVLRSLKDLQRDMRPLTTTERLRYAGEGSGERDAIT